MATSIHAAGWATSRRSLEEWLGISALMLAALVPLTEAALRWSLKTGIPGSSAIVQHLTLWIGFLGAALAARERRHLAVASSRWLSDTRFAHAARVVVAAISASVALGLAWGAIRFVDSERDSILLIQGWIPAWTTLVIMPAALLAIAWRLFAEAGPPAARAMAAAAVAAIVMLSVGLPDIARSLVGPAIVGLLAAAAFGAPIFVVIGGLALLLFFADGVPAAAIAVESYRLIGSPAIPTLAMFTLTGFILAEGGASRRLVRLFRALFGWLPGGLPIVATLVCAFFTTFTGATGVTILALGGLLVPVLRDSGYSERFAIGLVTSAGSIGLLFPPSLPPIIFGVVANVSILDVFVAGLIPGLLLVGAVAALGVREGMRIGQSPPRFDAREALSALNAAKWEVVLPVVVLGGLFGGVLTLLETAAVALLHAAFIEAFVHRQLDLRRHAPALFLRAQTLVGGVFMILAVAMGLTNYLVDADVPTRLAEWTQSHLVSRAAFLLALNLLLLLVGCVMDIFSAIAVVVPLILPVSRTFEVEPLHLAMIFLLNLELGYLTPPVGMNLFLAAYRFNRPPLAVCRDVLPFAIAIGAVVLMVTYLPALALSLVNARSGA